MEENQVFESKFIAAESVWERIKQAIAIYKNNFVGLTLLILFYNVLAFIISVWIWDQVIKWVSSNQNTWRDLITFFVWDTISAMIMLLAFIVGFLAYMIFFIPVFVGTLKSIRDAISGKEIHVWENLKYGFSHFFNVLRVYWYIFQYVFLTPVIFLITGLIVILIALVSGIESLFAVGWFLLISAMIVWIIYGVYRGLRSTFRLYAAIENEDFTKESFVAWLQETKGKLWRIIWNFILVAIIIWISTWIIWGIINTITGVNIEERTQGITSSLENNQAITWELIAELELDGAIVLNGLLITLIDAIGIIFMTLFTYIFYLRIRDEYKTPILVSENPDTQENPA